MDLSLTVKPYRQKSHVNPILDSYCLDVRWYHYVVMSMWYEWCHFVWYIQASNSGDHSALCSACAWLNVDWPWKSHSRIVNWCGKFFTERLMCCDLDFKQPVHLQNQWNRPCHDSGIDWVECKVTFKAPRTIAETFGLVSPCEYAAHHTRQDTEEEMCDYMARCFSIKSPEVQISIYHFRHNSDAYLCLNSFLLLFNT